MYGPPDLPPIGELTAQEPDPDRYPGELRARVLPYMGERDAVPPRRDPDAPNVDAIREQLGALRCPAGLSSSSWSVGQRPPDIRRPRSRCRPGPHS